MAATYTLGKEYTVDGLVGATDLEVTRSGERIDVTTRGNSKPLKGQVAGIPDLTFTCSVFAQASTKFEIGKKYAVTVNGDALADLICVDANREEAQEGVITYKLTFKQGFESESANQIDVGPGTYRGSGGGGGGT